MNKIYSQDFALRTSDFDCRGQIKPSAVLDLFQEVAGAHAIELGLGFDDLLKKELIWVIVKVKFAVINDIQEHQKVTVKTWPLPAGRVTLQREYRIEDENGKTLVKGTSEWVTVHSEKRRIVPPTNVYPLEEYCEDKMFEEKLVKVPDFTDISVKSEVTSEFCDLDRNGHVNNIRYADYVLNALAPKEQKIREFQIDFHREIMSGMKISILLSENANEMLAKGLNESGEKMFSCAINLD